ncbi:rab-GTPase-TBC domain-domain-containing protein [Syncephalastrum racemosum]|uniref:Rab-GTPase-TBC domain-domain-containing protein n=1 Tax=Syncephalastrum racemosum TaxID=13706 RepID=A0A1X2HLN5_SYNRA|nr:rab-GTPase-TBC domain-domain-containing protein [Syncephalastrum racemosum]
MDVKTTRHTSANLDEINARIAEILKDPVDILGQASFKLESLTLPELKDFAEQGGLGACVSKQDVLAETSEDLMYLSGERIVVLKHIEKDIYLGYCEGVIGRFSAENVHFVELDPRVLDSLDADLDYDYSYEQEQQRHSLQSFSSASDQYTSSVPDSNRTAQMAARSSFESLVTTSSSPSVARNNDLHIRTSTTHDQFDTSAFNDDYSDESDAEPTFHTSPAPIESTSTVMRASRASRQPRPAQRAPSPPSSKDDTVDEYGFIVEPKKMASRDSLRDASSKSMKAYREREIKWLNIVSKMDAGAAKKDAKLKKLVRSGVPTSVRSRVWQYLAGSPEYKKPGMYQNLCSRSRTPIFEVIERDIARCYPDHTLFKEENSQGQRDLADILKAYSHYNPQLEYCQGMGRLAGCLLMHMPAEDAFWLLVVTIDRYMNGYFTPSLSQMRIDAYIIGELLKEHQPKLAQHLENNDVQPIMYITPWFLTAFTMTLPWSSVLRVWDVFYFEGVKVFYRITLAILEICKDHLLNRCPSNSELLSFLLHIPHDYLAPDALLDTAFRLKLSKTDIKRFAKKASSSSESDANGLPVEHGLKNLMVGGKPSSSPSLQSFKGLGGKIIRKNSNNQVNKEFDHTND